MISGREITPAEKTIVFPMSEPKQASEDNPSGGPAGAKAVAEYSAELLTELRDLATAAGLTFLAYLIQVALEEAKIQADKAEED
jgi:hypothetical protein